MMSQILCLGRHTITGLIKVCGNQFQDWSAEYRMYSKDRFDETAIFRSVRKGIEDALGQRLHAPTTPKPKYKASAADLEKYKEDRKKTNINQYGMARLKRIREQMDQDGQQERHIQIAVDNRFTNQLVFKQLPPNTTLIGRIRKDTQLFTLPDRIQSRGRKRVYGEAIPTPEQIRQNESFSWQKVPAFVSGKYHEFKVKSVSPLRWRVAGERFTLQVIVIAPLAYRLKKGAKLLYREPAYLICTDPSLSIQEIIQSYFWRWDIEVNFRDEKTILGVGQAQLFNPLSTQKAPALAVAAYSLLLLAGAKAFGVDSLPDVLPSPKWRKTTLKRRPSTTDLSNILRLECWASAISNSNFSGFSTSPLTY